VGTRAPEVAPSAASEPAKSPRRKRALQFTAGVLGGTVVLLAILPTVLTTRPFISYAEGIAESKLGRPVTIGSVTLGWFSELAISEFTIPAQPGEGIDGPVLAVRGAKVPLNLIGALAMPPYELGPITVSSIEGNIYRFEDGSTNLDSMMKSLSGPPSTSSNDDKKSDADSAAFIPPIDGLNLDVKEVTLRVHDQATNLSTGFEKSNFSIEWKGAGKDAVVGLVGGLRINDLTTPFDLAASVADFTTAKGELTPDAARISLRLTHEGREPALLEGGYGPKDGLNSGMVRWNLDMEKLLPIARAFMQGADVPNVAGIVRGEIAAKGIGAASTQVSVTLSTSELRVPGTEGQQVLLPDVSAATTLVVRADDAMLDSVEGNLSAPGLTALVSATALPFTGPSIDTRISIKADASLETLSLALMKTAGIEVSRAPATGVFSITAQTHEEIAEGIFAADLRAKWQGGELRTLQPFAEDPPQLAAAPFDLKPTSFDVTGDFSFDPQTGEFGTTGLDFTAPGFGNLLVKFRGEAPAGVDPTFSGSATGELRLAELLKSLGPFAPQQIAQLAGNANVDIRAGALAGRPMTFDGGFKVADFTLVMAEPNLAIFRDATFAMDAKVKHDTATATTDIESFSIASPLLNMTARGQQSAAEGANGTAEYSIPLAANFALANAFAPIEALRGLDGTASGNITFLMNDPTAPNVQFTTQLADASTTLADGTKIALPITLAADISPSLGEGAPIKLSITSATLDYGTAAKLSASGSVSMEGTSKPTMLDLALDLDHAATLRAIPAAFLAKMPYPVSLDGTSHTTMSMRGDASTDPNLIDPMQLSIKSAGSIPSLTTELEQGAVRLQSATYDLALDTEMNLGTPETARFTLTTEVKSKELAAPGVTAMRDMQFALRADGKGVDAVNLMPGISFSSFEGDAAGYHFALPNSHAAFDIRTLQSGEHVKLESGTIELGTVAGWTGNGEWQKSTNVWRAISDLRLSSANALLEMITPPEGAAPLPRIFGTWSLKSDLASAEQTGAAATTPLPITGTTTLRAEAAAGDLGLGRTFSDLNGTVNFTAARDLDIATDVRMATLRFAPEPATGFKDVTISGGASLVDLQKLEVRDLAMNAAGGGMAAKLRGTVDGLRPTLLRAIENSKANRPLELPTGASGWLGATEVAGSGSLHLDMLQAKGFMPEIDTTGALDVDWTFASRPGMIARLDTITRFADAAFIKKGAWSVKDFAGEVGIAKSWRLSKSSPGITTPEQKKSTIREITYTNAPFGIVIRNMQLMTSGADQGVRIEADSPNAMGGPAKFTGSITLVQGEPIIDGTLQSTGADMRTILPAPMKNSPVALTVDAITRIKWDAGRSARAGNPLEGLDLTVNMPRVDRAALLAIMRALDPTGTNAAMKAAETAMTVGAPTEATLELRNGIVNFSISIQTQFGLRLPIDIIKRKPLGDFTDILALNEYKDKIASTRLGLLILLTEDLADLERRLAENDVVQGVTP
jgi:hypothetical protein